MRRQKFEWPRFLPGDGKGAPAGFLRLVHPVQQLVTAGQLLPGPDLPEDSELVGFRQHLLLGTRNWFKLKGAIFADLAWFPTTLNAGKVYFFDVLEEKVAFFFKKVTY